MPNWTGGSVPLGAGFPDLISVWWETSIVELRNCSIECLHALSYLRSVRRARLSTIGQRVGLDDESAVDCVSSLEAKNLIRKIGTDSFAIEPHIKNVLPRVVSIEVKVRDWKQAFNQAVRNSVFSHESYVAMPETIASKLPNLQSFISRGIGVISVSEDHTIQVIKDARVQRPSVWTYYFQLASIAAKAFQ